VSRQVQNCPPLYGDRQASPAQMTGLLVALLGLLFFGTISSAEASQYCNFEAGKDEPAANDLCMAVSTYRNQSNNEHDLHVAIQVYRRQHSALGWTSIGIGNGMAHALTFIIYGDPKSSSGPTLSVRRAFGHWEPELFDEAVNKGRVRVQQLESTWNSTSGSVAQLSFICYSCDTGLDPDLDPLVSTTTDSQPWIWAKNDGQRLSDYSRGASLEMHSHKNGYGIFYVDMKHNLAPASEAPSVPVVHPGVKSIGASETKNMTTVAESVTPWQLSYTTKVSFHGFFMSLAFLLLLPAGVFAILSGSLKAFQHHWKVQVAGIACISVGMILGFLLRGFRMNTTHQWLGLATVVAVGTQAALGVSHHLRFLQIRRRTWMSHIHIHLGRGVLVSGYCSVFTGLVLHRAGIFQFVVTGAIVVSEVGWILVTILRARKGPEDSAGQKDTYQLLKEEVE